MAGAGERVAGRLDDAFDAVEAAERLRVVGDERPTAVHGVAERCGGEFGILPAGAGQRFADLADIEVGNRDDVVAGDLAGLRQHHRAELAGADQSDPDRPSGRVTFGKL